MFIFPDRGNVYENVTYPVHFIGFPNTGNVIFFQCSLAIAGYPDRSNYLHNDEIYS